MANTAEKINRHLLAAETKDENRKNNIQFLQRKHFILLRICQRVQYLYPIKNTYIFGQ